MLWSRGLPKSLFRYRTIYTPVFDPETKEVRDVLDLDRLNFLLSNNLYFAPITSLNDPCELLYIDAIGLQTLLDAKKLRMVRSMGKKSGGPSAAVIEALTPLQQKYGGTADLDFFMNGPEDAVLATLARNYYLKSPEERRSVLRKLAEKTYGILSLTSLGDSPYMSWCYGDKHRGLCMEYSTAIPPFDEALKVRYQRHVPRLKFEKSEEILRTIALTKFSSWKEEQEWRCLRHIGKHPKMMPCKQSALTSIAFGPDMPIQDKRLIASRVRNHASLKSLEIYSFQTSPDSYRFLRVRFQEI